MRQQEEASTAEKRAGGHEEGEGEGVMSSTSRDPWNVQTAPFVVAEFWLLMPLSFAVKQRNFVKM